MGGWGGGGSKVFALRGTSSGEAYRLSHSRRSNVNAADVQFTVGGWNPGLLTFGAGGGAQVAGPGFEPPIKGTPVGCITTRQLLGLR